MDRKLIAHNGRLYELSPEAHALHCNLWARVLLGTMSRAEANERALREDGYLDRPSREEWPSIMDHAATPFSDNH